MLGEVLPADIQELGHIVCGEHLASINRLDTTPSLTPAPGLPSLYGVETKSLARLRRRKDSPECPDDGVQGVRTRGSAVPSALFVQGLDVRHPDSKYISITFGAFISACST